MEWKGFPNRHWVRDGKQLEPGIAFWAVTMEMRSLVNRDSEFRAGERGRRSVIHALRSISASDLDPFCVLTALVGSLTFCSIFVAPLWSLGPAVRGSGGLRFLSDHLPGGRHPLLFICSPLGWLKTRSISGLSISYMANGTDCTIWEAPGEGAGREEKDKEDRGWELEDNLK